VIFSNGTCILYTRHELKMQYPWSPLPQVLAGIERTMSPARLARFTPPGGDKNRGLRIYVWNARLCEEFYIPLQLTEVSLRNGIVKRLVGQYGPDWFQDYKFISTIPDRHKDEIRDTTISEKTKRGASFTVDHVVAGLSFGFWLNLMGHGVAHILWKQSINAPFPNLPAGVTRDAIYLKLEQFRKFRNSVMHHYAIFDKNPTAEYQNIRYLVGAMCTHTLWLMSELSNPAAIIQQRPQI
jgi:hypothetical protein